MSRGVAHDMKRRLTIIVGDDGTHQIFWPAPAEGGGQITANLFDLIGTIGMALGLGHVQLSVQLLTLVWV
ncbi:hypothetical protein N825_01210 [Skermanella stibiiresistens SB22]|uniref:Uncharacterized protein n=1 Tax=Skermanella stibiiresistens SB22 TaxID=1385369 RepID=W9HA36_9PROT|nr:hypothetical protein N825_01210 [Skermanella stibiiresistens SB22]